jgi:hypothetical protein
VSWTVQPEPPDEAERAALLRALEEALGEDGAGPAGYSSRWWRAGLADVELGGSAPEEPGREPRVVEP